LVASPARKLNTSRTRTRRRRTRTISNFGVQA
jgi:hypothetical protein